VIRVENKQSLHHLISRDHRDNVVQCHGHLEDLLTLFLYVDCQIIVLCDGGTRMSTSCCIKPRSDRVDYESQVITSL